jgi:Lipopolysaccharide kinase (Kdo/WaaP) family
MLYVLLLLLPVVGGVLLTRTRRARRVGRSGYVSFNPAEASWLRGLGLCQAGDFLDLEAVIVSGHPGRHVGWLTLGGRVVYLKREQNVRWTTRLVNFLAGYGWAARCVREAAILQALERDDLPAPQWLAAGEDEAGRAFLLVEGVSGAQSVSAAMAGLDAGGRRRLAVRVGEGLGRLHAAGFFHRDLYAKHVLVRGDDICLLDWQRAWRGAWIPRWARIRDLAAVHATIPESVAGPRERLACLRAYLAASGGRGGWRGLVAEVDRVACRMRRRRHIREKRQVPTAAAQAWICLDGEALCVTPTLADLAGTASLDWLRLERQPAGPTPLTRRWVELPGERRALLLHRRSSVSLKAAIRRLVFGLERPNPEQRQATLLWRLERHGVAVPEVLAQGRRWVSARSLESFLLVLPEADTVELATWLHRAEGERRADVLRQLGATLARLHGACCHLRGDGLEGFAVHVTSAGARLLLGDVEGIAALRRPCAIRAETDLAQAAALVRTCGGDEASAQEFLRGYAGEEPANREPLARVPSSGVADHFSNGEGSTVDRPPGFWTRLVRGWRRLRQRPDWASFAGPDWADRVMDVSVTDQFHAKQGRSTGRWVLHAPDGSGRRLAVFLKRHYKIPFWDAWRALLLPRGSWSPAMMEYAHLEWAREQGIPVPATVAVADYLLPGGKLQSFLAVEELTGMLPLHEAIPLAQAKLPEAVFRRWKRGLIVEIARLTRMLHDRKHYHKDLYLCHFFIPEPDTTSMPAGEADGPCGAGWRGRVTMIDLHRLTYHPWTWGIWLLKDLAQLLYSSEVQGVDTRDRLAFWMHYRGPGSQRWSYRLLRRAILFKWRRYRRHNLRLQERRNQAA